MIKQLKLITPFILSLCITVSCSAQDSSPADQLVKGPIEITTEWQTIVFDKPLQASPHVQAIRLLSCNNQYSFVATSVDEQGLSRSDRFKRLADQQVVEPEIIANDGKNEYRLSASITGYDYAGPTNGCKFVGYSLKGDEPMKLALPEGTQFVSIKIRANVPMSVDHLYWVASGYERSPNDTWDSLHPSRIIDMKSQALLPHN